MPAKPKRPSRPQPPAGIGDWIDDKPFWYAPAADMPDWVMATFLMEDAPLYNEDHKHLLEAHVAFLWAGEPNARRGRQVLGQCEEVTFRCGAWQKGRQQQQMTEWFGTVPAYLITLDAEYARECSDLEFCALVEHELLHIAHAVDQFGQPRFNKDTGQPVLTLRDHDVSEFVSIVRRYGAGRPDGAVAQMVAAAGKAPEVSGVNIARACGTCMMRAA